jgi:hypothetical protein
MKESGESVVDFKENSQLVRYWCMWALLLPFIFIKEANGVRGILPEPFDFFSHAGNLHTSVCFGWLAGLFSGRIFQEHPESKLRLRVKMAAGGLAVGTLVNLVETEWGARLFEHFVAKNTPDPIDFLYGVAVATLAGAFGPSIKKETK